MPNYGVITWPEHRILQPTCSSGWLTNTDRELAQLAAGVLGAAVWDKPRCGLTQFLRQPDMHATDDFGMHRCETHFLCNT